MTFWSVDPPVPYSPKLAIHLRRGYRHSASAAAAAIVFIVITTAATATAVTRAAITALFVSISLRTTIILIVGFATALYIFGRSKAGTSTSRSCYRSVPTYMPLRLIDGLRRANLRFRGGLVML